MFKGADVIFWKMENGKKYVLLAERAGHGPWVDHNGRRHRGTYGLGYYSNFGGHFDERFDLENGKVNYFNIAIREGAEETGIVKQDSVNHITEAKAFFSNPDFKLKKRPLRRDPFIWYQNVTYSCEVTGKMKTEKWYEVTREHAKGTMDWYPVDKLPKKLLFACRLNILMLMFERSSEK